MRVTIACPVAMTGDANAFARAVGQGPDDGETFGAADWTDAAGNLYAVASGLVGETFPVTVRSPLVAPPWGADMAAAARAQAALGEIGAPAAPDRLAAVIGEDIPAALAALGVTRLPD